MADDAFQKSLEDLIRKVSNLEVAVKSQQGTNTHDAVQWGIVADAIPSARCYRVHPAGDNRRVILCFVGIHSSIGKIGCYDADTIVPGTRVRYIKLEDPSTGLIICAEPDVITDVRRCCMDAISQGSNVGIPKEFGYHALFQRATSNAQYPNNSGVVNYGGRTPWDSVEAGEFNRSTETGMMLHVDSYMAFMRANEMSGLWCFYWDGLTRIAGENFQEWAGPTEREVYDDEGETFYYHGIATYPWEQQGMLLGPTTDAVYEFTDVESLQLTTMHYGRAEPNYDDTQPFHRLRTYAGYIGQGEKVMLCAPNSDSETNVYQYSDQEYQAVGLHERQVTMGGHWYVRGALGNTIAKRPVIPVPKRCEIVTSANGDTPDNYKASSYYGSGDSHLVDITPDLPGAVDSEEASIYAIAALPDLLAHMFNWEAGHPFYYHASDYVRTDEGDYEHINANQSIQYWGDYLDSTSGWFLPVPEPVELEIDHRTGMTAKVYENTSYITQLDNGGIAIGDGFGSEIRMAGGCIYISCPGDIFLEPGRNFTTWAGRDVNIRAWNCIDLTTTTRDIRLKAEKNLMMLGGNSGSGAVFIECRATGSSYDFTVVGEDTDISGIILRAIQSDVVTTSNRLYLRTVGEDEEGKDSGTSNIGEVAPDGSIMIDARAGDADICTRSDFVKHWVRCAVVHAFPDESASEGVNIFTVDGTTLCSDLFVDGDVLAYGSTITRQDFIAGEGHMYSPAGGMVSRLTVDSLSSVSDAIDQGHTYEESLITWADERWVLDIEPWYDEGNPGNTNCIKSMWFALRIDVDYKADYFVHYETRWQQMARTGAVSAPETWTEAVVEGNQEDTYPFPGKAQMVDNAVYMQVDPLLVNSDGIADPVGANYESPVILNAPNNTTLDSEYTIIGKTV